MTETNKGAAPAAGGDANDAAAKAAADAKKAEAAAAKAKAKQEAKDKREADKKAKAEAKAAAKKAAKDAKDASKMPEQNGIRRPKADTTCGKVWAIFDQLSAKTGAPATIGDSLKAAEGVAEATVRTQYARWRKFHGITGRQERPSSAGEGTQATA